MIILSILTSALVTKLKRHEAIKAESERERMRANLLRAVSVVLKFKKRYPLQKVEIEIPTARAALLFFVYRVKYFLIC